jgi:hypothetical protein
MGWGVFFQHLAWPMAKKITMEPARLSGAGT